jgi:protocatechuate 3,4-dioxygenase beta subunit
MFALSLAILAFASVEETDFRIRVVDESKKPIPGANVHVSIWSESKKPPTTDYTTDADGVALVKRPKQLQIIRVWVSKKGYAPLFRGWETGTHDHGKLLPASFEFPMRKGATAGGRLMDTTGKGVSGGKVEVRFDKSTDDSLPNDIKYSDWLAIETHAAVSDKDGRWSIANVPPKTTALSLKINHPDFVSDLHRGELQRAQGVTIAQLLQGAATIKLEPGARISGKVTDSTGKPLAKAIVIWDDNPYFTPGSQEMHTDSDGKFILPTLKPGKQSITVVAKGFQPQRRLIECKAGSHVADFKMEPGKRLRVQVVDGAGKPIKAYFSIHRWQDKESIYTHVHPNVLPLEIPFQTNDAGLYEWSWAPADAVTYFVQVKGLQNKLVTFTASDATTERVVMKPTPSVAGKITDAKTGKPVERFQILRVNDFGRGSPRVERGMYAVDHQKKGRTAGEYRVELPREDVDYMLLAEAEGYRTAASRPHLLKDGVKNVDFKLETAAPVRGRVIGPDGKPVADAKVSLANEVQIYEHPNGYGNLSSTTNDRGEFSLPAQFSRFALFVEHPTGYFRKEFGRDDKIGDLKIEKWASLRGAIWQDDKPARGVPILLFPLERSQSDRCAAAVNMQIVSGTEGEFAFDRVPPGRYSIRGYLGPWRPSPLTSSETVPLDLKPGDDVRLDLGKNGATLVGKIDLQGELPKGLDLEYSLNYLTRRTPDLKSSSLPNLDEPRQILSDDESLKSYRRFFVKPQRDGRFRIVGVPAGEYFLSLQVYEKPDG